MAPSPSKSSAAEDDSSDGPHRHIASRRTSLNVDPQHVLHTARRNPLSYTASPSNSKDTDDSRGHSQDITDPAPQSEGESSSASTPTKRPRVQTSMRAERPPPSPPSVTTTDFVESPTSVSGRQQSTGPPARSCQQEPRLPSTDEEDAGHSDQSAGAGVRTPRPPPAPLLPLPNTTKTTRRRRSTRRSLEASNSRTSQRSTHSGRPSSGSGRKAPPPAAASDGSDTEVELEDDDTHISGVEVAAGAAAAALARRLTSGSRRSAASVRRNKQAAQSFREQAAEPSRQGSRMFERRRTAREDDQVLREEMAEDGLGDGPNPAGRYGAPPDRNSSANNDKPARPSRPTVRRGPTLGSTVSYTSTVVYTSIFADIKNDAIAMAGEFVGTILFLITSLGAAQAASAIRATGDGPQDPQANPTEQLIATLYRAIAAGFALYGTASIFYRFTGSIFNPSVSLALALTRVIRPVRFILVSTSQMLGGIVACWILNGLLPGSSELNLELTASANIAQGLFIESFATCTLIMTVLMLGVEKHLVTPHAPLGFGLTLTASMLFAMPYTGGGINVARAFGSGLVEGFQRYHWIYWLGPTIGAVIASSFYVFLRHIQYWQVNPGQDSIQPLTGPPEEGKKMRQKAGVRKRDVLVPPH